MWFAAGTDGYGCLDIAIPNGTSAFIPAVKSFSKNYDTTDSGSTVDPKIDTFSSQISVDYVGNAKSFATIEGTRTHHLVTGDVAESTIHEVITADFWGQSVTVADYTMEASSWNTVTSCGAVRPSAFRLDSRRT